MVARNTKASKQINGVAMATPMSVKHGSQQIFIIIKLRIQKVLITNLNL